MLSEDESRVLSLIQKAKSFPGLESNHNPTGYKATDSNDAESLKRRIEHLEQQLRVKTELCHKLEASITRIMSVNSSEVQTSTQNLTEEYFDDTLKTWKAQVWFGKPVPPLVDAIYDKLRRRVEHDYETKTRRTAFTMTECQHLVSSTRKEWNDDLPLAITRSLTVDNRVFSSAHDRANGSGAVCEAVHYLIYLVFKLYNRAAHVLHSLKKKEGYTALESDVKLNS